jgi:hypothetical protein
MNFDDLKKILFQSDEQVYIGNAFGTQPCTQYKRGEFFCINPLSGPRSDLNVSALRNFLFEIDTLALDEQLKLLEPLKPFFASIVYSGGKSYHAIVSLETALPGPGTREGIESYKATWNTIARSLESKMGNRVKFDTACQNPSRLSRFPGWHRTRGNMQELIHLGCFISQEKLRELIPTDLTTHKKPINFNTNYQPKSYSGIEELKNFLPVELFNRLRFPTAWANSVGMYPELLKLALWTIDSTGANKDLVVELMSKYTFPGLIKAGYPAEKLLKPINHAFNMKNKKG